MISLLKEEFRKENLLLRHHKPEAFCESQVSKVQIFEIVSQSYYKCIRLIHRHSRRDRAPPNFICLSVCSAFTAHISVTIHWILMKLGGRVGT